MTFPQLLARYESGAIADHEFTVESLNHLDPADPSIVLNALPAVTLRRLRDWVESFRPGEMRSLHGSRIPDVDQVEAARKWLEAARIAPSPSTVAAVEPDPCVRDQSPTVPPSVQAIR